MAFNVLDTYQNNKVMTASPAELTLMLYEGAIRFCNMAASCLERNEIAKVNEYLQKAQKIILEFRSTLDDRYEVSKEFDKVYEYIYNRLVEANIRKDKSVLEDALTDIRGMRDTWKEVMRLNKVG